MARPIPDINLRDLSKLHEEIKPKDSKSVLDITIDRIRNKSTKNLVFGTITGWLAGVVVIKVGKIAAFGLGGGMILLHFATEFGYINVNWDKVKESAGESQAWMEKILEIAKPLQPKTPNADQQRPLPTDHITKNPESLTPEETTVFEKPFIPSKPIPHSPKISPSSIPNPSPSVTTNKPTEPGYPNYGSYLYSIPGYSAFQPISYPGMIQPSQAPIQNETPKEFVQFPATITKNIEETNNEDKSKDKQQTDFEEHFTPEIIPAKQVPEVKTQTESKMSIASLIQGSATSVPLPPQINKDVKKKQSERFSLKTSIPISKIDMKCVSNPPDAVYQNSLAKKTAHNPSLQKVDAGSGSRVEIQSNVVIKTATKDPEVKSDIIKPFHSINNSISTLLNAAEAINKNESQFRPPEPKQDVPNEVKDPPVSQIRPIFNPINIDTKVSCPKAPETYNEQKNQILLIQNKPSNSNPKMLLTIQQQNPQVLIQRTKFDSKNLQAPSRLSNQIKKSKEDIVSDNSTSSKVVALKRLHQENCDENDFENLITENQIYGNKIVVKEKSQGTLQEQDLKKSKATDKHIQPETKNVVLQPNFLYLSNVQFPTNLMMIKNNTKNNQANDANKAKITSTENKVSNEVGTMTNVSDVNSTAKNPKPKEIQVLKSSNSVLQPHSNKSNKTDLVVQTNQKVIMNPQILYQVPMIVDTDNKTNQPFINKEYPKLAPKKDYQKQFDQTKNDKLYIACPYQMDSKLQPKIVITNIRPKITKVDEISSLDIYEKRKKMRRMKYLTNRDGKEVLKTDTKKVQDNFKDIITPDKMKAEIYNEYSKNKKKVDAVTSESDSDYGDEDLIGYNNLIRDYGDTADGEIGKVEFLAGLRLATHNAYKEKELDIQERILRTDSVATAYIAAGRLECFEDANIETPTVANTTQVTDKMENTNHKETGVTLHRKQKFMSQLKLVQVSSQYKEGYERTWQEIVKERKRRHGIIDTKEKNKQPKTNLDLDTNGQLELLTEIKKCVNENNNLIKKRLDSVCNSNNEESIRILAEKNFSELNRLSKLADRSVKLFSGQDMKKRDLNPGFDSENMQKLSISTKKYHPDIIIPNISKIVSLKSKHESQSVSSMQATSMDEPRNSAVCEMSQEITTTTDRVREYACQTEEVSPWPGFDAILKSYKEFEAARKKEIAGLHQHNTSLRVESAHVTRAASRESDKARALLAERQHLALEENGLRVSIRRLCAAIEAIKNS